MHARFIKFIVISSLAVFAVQAGPALAAGEVTLFMDRWARFNANEPPAVLPDITITDVAGGTLKPEFGVTIYIPDIDMLWEKTVTEITVNGVLKPLTYTKNLKGMTVPIAAPLKAGEALKISGQKVRIYGPGGSYRDITADINGDGIGDVTGTNGLQVDSTTSATDFLVPYGITNLTSAVTETSVFLTWELPPDLDYNGILLTKTTTRAGTERVDNFTIDKRTKEFLDSAVQTGEEVKYSFRTKDNIDNRGAPVEITVIVQAPAAQPALVTTPPAETEETVVEPASEAPMGFLDVVTDERIAFLLFVHSDLSLETPGLKMIAYLVDAKLLKGSRGKFGLSKKVRYSDLVKVLAHLKLEKSYKAVFKDLKKQKVFVKKALLSRYVSAKEAFAAVTKIFALNDSDEAALEVDLKGRFTRARLIEWLTALTDKGYLDGAPGS